MADEKRTVLIDLELDSKGFDKEADKSADSMEDLGKSTADSKEEITEFNGALDGMLSQLGIAPGALGGAKKGVIGLTGGFKSLKVAIASTGIGLLIVALGSLVTFFQKTARGQKEFRVITETLSAVLGVFTDRVILVGEALFNAFKDPKQAVIDLWDTIKENVINRFTGLSGIFINLGKVIKASLTGNFDEAGDAAVDMLSSIAQTVTGIEEPIRKARELITGLSKEVQEESIKAIELTRIENKLIDDQIKSKTILAALERDIAIAKLESEDRINFAATERLISNQKALDLIKEQFAVQKNLLAQELAILEGRQALGENTEEDNLALAEMRAELIRLTADEQNALKELVVQRKGIVDEVQAEREATIERIEEIDSALEQREKDRIARLLKVNIDAERVKLDIAKTSSEKAIAIKKKEEEIKRLENATTAQQTVGFLGFVAGALDSFFGKGKATAIANVGINTAEGISKAIAQLGVFGPAASIVLGALGLKQISEIESKESSFAKGGMIFGGSHAQGGVNINTEGGEAVLNKRSMANPVLRSMASRINEIGGGVPFDNPVAKKQFGAGGVVVDSLRSIERSMAGATSQQPVLVVDDFNEVAGRINVIDDLSTL